MKTLVPNIHISKTTEGRFVICAAEKYFAASHETALLVELMSSHIGATSSELASMLSKRLNCSVSSDEVIAALEKLPASFFEGKQKSKHFNFSISILKGKPLKILARISSVVFIPIFGLTLVSCILCMLFYVNSLSTNDHSISMVNSLLVLISILIHEIGHASACYAMGAKLGIIGIGLRGITPTFYTDVSDIWILGRKKRMVVDASGVYFQLGFATMLAVLIPLFPMVLGAIKIIILLAAMSCLPYFKFDGYWFLSDWLGENNFENWIKKSTLDLFMKIKSGNFVNVDLYRLFGLAVYFSGFILLQVWIFSTLWIFIKNNILSFYAQATFALNIVIDYFKIVEWYMRFNYASLIFFVLLLSISSVCYAKNFRFRFSNRIGALLSDFGIIISSLSTLLLIRCIFPIYSNFPTNKKNIEKINVALMSINPSIANPRTVATKNVISRCQKVIWYLVLKKVSVQTGIWLIKNTHRIHSKTTFSDLSKIPGPVVIVAPHFGSFLSGALMLLAEIGNARPIHLFYADPKIEPDNERYQKFYRRYFPNLSICLNNRTGLRKAINALRRGEVLVIMPDVFFGGSELVRIQLMGRTIGVMSGIAYFYSKFNAKVVPIFSYFDGFSSVNIEIEPALVIDKLVGDFQTDQIKIMSDIFIFLETWIRRYPHEWHCWEKFVDASETSNAVITRNYSESSTDIETNPPVMRSNELTSH